ncbi:hypothetical protein [Streptomyces sp. AS02]|uniref:hypothetical protein n=1 Tax=Streptomyces sp. AS02 TaxID=2938946 RepID=UPI00201FB70A|nr:hypothetical protein [Streptomyces sp. AS02]MCL8013990.1 hypothetical protein [Streptomyces sp. AS02]
MDRQLQLLGWLPAVPGPVLRRQGNDDALAVSYTAEVLPLGIDTTIVAPGAFTAGTNRFTNVGASGGP